MRIEHNQERPVQIALCDDDKQFVQEYRSIVSDILANEVGLAHELTTFTAPEALLDRIRNGQLFDILLLDIMFADGMDGRELADRIRDYDMEVKIIFVSTEDGLAETLIPVQPSGYIKKSALVESTSIQLTEAMSRVNVNYLTLETSVGDRRVSEERFYLGKVVYVEVAGRYSHFYKYDRTKTPLDVSTVRKPLNTVEAMLAKNHLFVRVNRTTIVNSQYISRLDMVGMGQVKRGRRKYVLVLRTGQSFEVGDKYLTKVKLAYTRYVV